MRCLIWAAVSSKPQADPEKDSIDSQIRSARDLIAKNEWHEVHDPIVIPGHSRSRHIFLEDIAQELPQYAQLMRLAREGEIDLVIVRGRDRLARQDSVISTLEAYLSHHNVQVLSLSMPTRVVDPQEFATRKDRSSIWLRSIERAKASDELHELKARHHFGMVARVKRGNHPGNLPLGYRRNPESKKIEVVEEEAALVRQCFYRFLKGDSFNKIAKWLGPLVSDRNPDNRSIGYLIQNEHYVGRVVYGRHGKYGREIVAEGDHPAIIDQDTWAAAQAELKRRRELGKRSPFTRNPLSGLVFCGYCEGRMKVDSGIAQRYRYYICKRPGCIRNSYALNDLEALTAKVLRDWIQDPQLVQNTLEKRLQQARDSVGAESRALETILEQKRRALARWEEDYELGLLERSDFYEKRYRLLEEIVDLEARFSDLQPELDLNAKQRIGALERLQKLTGGDIESRWHDPTHVAEIKALLRRLGLIITIKDREARFSL